MPPEDLTSIDVSQLDALAKLEADQRAIRALSDKATWRRDKEAEIYSRVIGDYAARMAAIAAQADPVRHQVRDDFQKLEALYLRYGEALDQAKVQLQECEFRREVGEFTQEEFQRCQQAAEHTIGEREVEFEGVRKLRLRYLELLPGEPVAKTPPVPAPPAPAPAVAFPAPAAPTAAAVITAAAATRASASAAPPAAAEVDGTSARTREEPFAPVPVKTVFQRPPTPTDFKVPPPGKAAADTEAFQTLSVAAALLIEDRSGLPGPHHRLGVLTIIGRTQDNQIVVPTKEVSRRHAEIAMTDSGYVLKDLGSPNGTFVNGERITEHRLQEGDRITLGGKVFVFKAP